MWANTLNNYYRIFLFLFSVWASKFNSANFWTTCCSRAVLWETHNSSRECREKPHQICGWFLYAFNLSWYLALYLRFSKSMTMITYSLFRLSYRNISYHFWIPFLTYSSELPFVKLLWRRWCNAVTAPSFAILSP